MQKFLGLLGGVGLGAAVMYAFDPDRGSRRRAAARDKMIHIVRRSERAVDKASRDLTHRAWGLVAEARSALGSQGASDMLLVNRVRSAIGRTVSHPHAVAVTAQEGRITLRGPVLAAELDPLIEAVSAVRGVGNVENQLEAHPDADNEPALQGGRHLPTDANWPPAARLVAGVGGALLTWAGAKHGGVWGSLLGAFGLGLVARAATNLEIAALFGDGQPRRNNARVG